MKPLLDITDVSLSYHSLSGETPALSHISFQLMPGEFLAIVGPSGCGKSTLLNLICGLLRPEQGQILLDGTPVTSGDCRIGYMLQKDHLLEWRTIYKNVLLGLEIRRELTAEKLAYVNQLLSDYGLDKFRSAHPSELSGGMRQRVMIAMALVCKPEILIADEPTTALDVTIQAQILDLMNQLKKETGTSILFITHDLGVVAEVCDDVAVMYCGRVVERGDVKTIFANPSHPYTKGLLGSIPRLGDAGKELKSIPGNVPNPKYMPKGCKFEPRCPYASEKCREEEPGFFQIEEGHISRCWLCESGQLKTDHVEKAGD